MFNHVDNRAVVQRAVKEVKTAGDLDSLTFEQLSFFESQRIRREVFGECIKFWDNENEIVINDDESDLIWEDIKTKFDTEKGKNPPVLYELMTGEAGGEQDIVYPGLDSCLGITITKADNSLKKGTHLVQPNETTIKKYLEQLKGLNEFFAEGDNVQIACNEYPADINNHKASIEAMNKSGTLQGDANQALEIFNKFYRCAEGLDVDCLPIDGFEKKEVKLNSGADVKAKYNTNTIHSVS